MGYSIYDYYGMSNDLQNRYDASKNAGRSATTGATGLSFNTPNNAPFKQQIGVTPANTQTTTASVPTQQGASIYEVPDDSRSFVVYTDKELENNPSPGWMGPVNNALWGGLLGGASAISGLPISLGYDIAKNSATNPNYTFWDALKSAGNYAIGSVVPGYGGKYGGQIGSQIGGKYGGVIGTMFGSYVQGKAQQTLLEQVINSLTKDDDPYQGERGWLGKTIDTLTGKYSPDKPTIGNPVTDPFLAVGPDTENYKGDNMLGDPENDPYGATPDSGWGGSSSMSDTLGNDISGYDWSFGDI